MSDPNKMFVYPKDVDAFGFDWGRLALTVAPEVNGAARSVRKDVILLCHGGPISMPDDARYILERCPGLHGFYGASSMERLPAEAAIRDQTASFKALPIRK